jgi:hypothetical protein
MRIHARLCTLASLCLLASTASGHDTLPRNWCTTPGTHPVIVGEFSLTAKEILDPNAPSQNCGAVGRGPWARATQVAHGYCAAFSTNKEIAMPIVLGPDTYNNERDHHELYEYSQGLQGVCVVCVP